MSDSCVYWNSECCFSELDFKIKFRNMLSFQHVWATWKLIALDFDDIIDY